jgi:hypothetical protein
MLAGHSSQNRQTVLFSELLGRKMENKKIDTGNIMSSAAAATAIAAAAAATAHIVAIALVAVACLPSLPSPSLSHAIPVANAMALATLALFDAHHPYSPSPFLPSPSSLLPLTSATPASFGKVVRGCSKELRSQV